MVPILFPLPLRRYTCGFPGSSETLWQDHRLRARQIARRRGAARVLAAAEKARRVAEEKATARERAAASVSGKLRGQEEADRAALEVEVGIVKGGVKGEGEGRC